MALDIGGTMDQELFARFRKCAVDVLSVDADKVVPEASFGDDLEADSLDLVELVTKKSKSKILTPRQIFLGYPWTPKF